MTVGQAFTIEDILVFNSHYIRRLTTASAIGLLWLLVSCGTAASSKRPAKAEDPDFNPINKPIIDTEDLTESPNTLPDPEETKEPTTEETKKPDKLQEWTYPDGTETTPIPEGIVSFLEHANNPRTKEIQYSIQFIINSLEVTTAEEAYTKLLAIVASSKSRLYLRGSNLEKLENSDGSVTFYPLDPNMTLHSLEPLAEFTGLKELRIDYALVKDLSPIQYLPNLESLEISYSPYIIDITPIAQLKALKRLDIKGKGGLRGNLEDISAIRGIATLEQISFRSNLIRDISAMSPLSNLVKLDIGDNDIDNIAPLAELSVLANLNISKNNIIDISPLRDLPISDKFVASGNPIEKNKTLENCPQSAASPAIVDFCSSVD